MSFPSDISNQPQNTASGQGTEAGHDALAGGQVKTMEEKSTATKIDDALQKNAITKESGVADIYSGVHSSISKAADIISSDKASAGDKALAVATATGELAMQAMQAKNFVNNLVSKLSEAVAMPILKAMAGPLKGIACLPIAKQLDPVLGIDVHMVVFPPVPAPVPLPHPYFGLIFDPKDWVSVIALSLIPPPDAPPDAAEDPHGAAVQGAKGLAFQLYTMAVGMLGGATVKIGPVVPRAVAGTKTKNFPHFPMGPAFHPVFMAAVRKNHGYVFLGSLFVAADGEPLASGPFINNDCWDIGIPALLRQTELKRLAPMYLYVPSGFIMPIPWNRPILVNPVPTPINPLTIGERLFKFALGRLKARRAANKPPKPPKPAKPCSRVSRAAHNLNDKLFGKFPGLHGKVKNAIGTHLGHPVDVASGHLFTDNEDFALPGPIPLTWERAWYSTSNYNGPLGHGWHHSYDMALAINKEERMAIARLDDGRTITFDYIPLRPDAEPRYHRSEKMWLHYHADGFYYLRTAEGLIYNFSTKAYSEREDSHLLTSVANASGFALRFGYNNKGWLQNITDSAGRLLTVENDAQGRITAIYAPHPERQGETFAIARYRYNSEGDMAAHIDALEQAMLFEYERHLLVKETWRNGQEWFFKYNGATTGAKCIETWGTDNLLHYKLQYHEGYTIATNSLGHTSHYYHQHGLVYKTIDPSGAEWHNRYNEYDELQWATDPLGHQTGYTHDEWGNVATITEPDGQFTQVEYYTPGYPHLPSEAMDVRGGKWQWEYDEAGNITKRINPLKAKTTYTYEDGLLQKITAANGSETALAYDRSYNLQKITAPNGAITHYDYNILGNCTQIINPKGCRQIRDFDLLGRTTSLQDFDGNLVSLRYDAIDNIVNYRDKHKEVSYTYSGLWKLRTRTEAGATVYFNYDTEEQLRKIVNEHGLAYNFELDGAGNVVQEEGFDGMIKRYERNAAGWVTRVNRPQRRFTQYAHDEAGRITTVTYHDGTTESYAYDKGALQQAINADATVSFERDILGNITKETCNGYEVSSKYDDNSNRVHIISSLGADIDLGYDIMGDVVLQQAMGWKSETKRDVFGLEIEKELLGGIISKLERDSIGRLTSHWVGAKSGGQMQRAKHFRQYRWDAGDQLKEIIDQSTGTTTFEHDKWDNLSKTVFNNGDEQLRNPDMVGNLFESKDRRDRKYNKGGQLKESKTAFYFYDEEGFLIEKKCKNGDTWKYEWNAAGMLQKVARPDKTEVTFGYDALGRRVWKKFKSTLTKWVWDGNKPLHEWKEFDTATANEKNFADNLITWIFEEDSFAPAAKIKNDKRYSLICDHLGTPTQGYNEEGALIWQRELDSYGKVRMLKGDEGFCDYLYQGQLLDSETGLYYNRFRYYASEEGMYISQDPIGLASGEPNLYAYVKDPNIWIDILGLQSYDKKKLKELGLKGVDLRGKSFNAGRKKLEAAGFKFKERTKTGRMTFEHPETGTKVHFDGTAKSKGSLAGHQDPHWHIQDKYGHGYGSTGLPKDQDKFGGHIPSNKGHSQF